MGSLRSILGLRSNVSALVYEDYCGVRICIGGFYSAEGKIIPLDGLSLDLNTVVQEFHWNANSLEVVI